MFQQMQQQGVAPNTYAFTNVVKAYSELGLSRHLDALAQQLLERDPRLAHWSIFFAWCVSMALLGAGGSLVIAAEGSTARFCHWMEWDMAPGLHSYNCPRTAGHRHTPTRPARGACGG